MQERHESKIEVVELDKRGKYLTIKVLKREEPKEKDKDRTWREWGILLRGRRERRDRERNKSEKQREREWVKLCLILSNNFED